MTHTDALNALLRQTLSRLVYLARSQVLNYETRLARTEDPLDAATLRLNINNLRSLITKVELV